ncbi:MAG: DUF4190 domain-containing protein [Deltaproteobacteria bacterium]|nr:DUF4190 domain-containing protein [Deltaproteobacteria bacterium]
MDQNYGAPGGPAPQHPTPNPYGFTAGPGPAPMGQPQQQQPQGNGLAVAGMVLGIIALVLCWVPILSQILALLAIIFGAIGNGKANKVGKGKGMAMAGLILGIISLIAGISLIAWAVQQRNKYRSYGSYDRYGSLTTPVVNGVDVTPDHVV